MVSVPDWTGGGYSFRGTSRSSWRTLARWFMESVLRQPPPAPPVAKSLIYVLCEEYRHFDLWSAYHAFRLDPRARNWNRLRRRTVPWQGGKSVEELVQRVHPSGRKRTPDPITVEYAIATAQSCSSSKKRRV